MTNATFQTMTSINVTNVQGFGPVNQSNSVRGLNNPKSTTVVAPGTSALSSIATVRPGSGSPAAWPSTVNACELSPSPANT